MIDGIIETAIQVSGVIFLSPLVQGIYENLKAKTESRKGPRILQPYYDLYKYLRKERNTSNVGGGIYKHAPYLVFSILFTISFVIPVVIPNPTDFAPMVDFLGGAMLFSLASVVLILAALDSGSNYAALGAGRSATFSALAEPTLILVFFAVAIQTGTNNPYIANVSIASSTTTYLSLTHILSMFAFFMIFLFETGKLPLESSGMSEMGMIDEGRTYEYGGKDLFLLKESSWMKQYLLGSVLLNVFLFPWFMQQSLIGSLLDIPIMIGKWIILIIIVIFIEQSLAKVRLFKIADYLAVSFALSIFSVVIFVLGGLT
ncbi:MAG: respiratory chain complex I subunit 1 family protein [Thermoplasmataceae archaeon]